MTRIAIALTPEYADWECALIAAVARGYLGIEIVTATPDGLAVTSMGGFHVTPDLGYSALAPEGFDALIVPGGLAWEKGVAPDLAPLVRDFHGKGRLVAGICAAASMLAGTGLLDGVAHTGNSLDSHRRAGAYGGAALYRDEPQAVADGRIVTAPGTAPFSFAVEILKALGHYDGEAEREMRAFGAEHR